jgi:peptidoglycan/LPS O-acetylase OafA/YrhL
MLDYVIMMGILVFLVLMLTHGSKYISSGNDNFFDMDNTKAMRGFWCLIVILVHIPTAYQNKIQDMIGSFAYIGVTFFFMTSAYGLSVGISKKINSTERFWTSRLPKLILPNWISNVVIILLDMILLAGSSRLGSPLQINVWVRWLLVCYVAFWIGYRFKWKEKLRRPIVCVVVIAFSLLLYILKLIGIVQTTTWCTESIGFVWGIVLFANYDSIKKLSCQKWILKVSVACLSSLVLGVSYLSFKHIVFWGDYILKILLGVAILAFILLLNEKIQIGNKISYFLGSISFEMYLMHCFVFEIVEKVLPNINSSCFIILSIITTVILATIVHIICDKLLKLLKKAKIF